MAPERSRPERSRPESFLPVRSAGLRDVAEAMAASTSARVISADAISGDARSTCCIISCEAPGMAEARPNIAIAPIRIDARIIVFALPRCLPPLSGRCSDDKRPNALSPTAIGVTTSTIAFSRLLERRAQTEGRCAVFAVRFVRGSGGARVHTTPWPWLENCRNRADCDNICGGSCEPQKHLRVGEEWAGTDILRADSFASAQNGLNVFGCSRS